MLMRKQTKSVQFQMNEVKLVYPFVFSWFKNYSMVILYILRTVSPHFICHFPPCTIISYKTSNTVGHFEFTLKKYIYIITLTNITLMGLENLDDLWSRERPTTLSIVNPQYNSILVIMSLQMCFHPPSIKLVDP